MRTYVIDSDGGASTIHLLERPIPEPGPGQVLVRMRANSINYRDLLNILDPKARGIRVPRIPNSDGAGVVEAVGRDVSRFAVGEQVVGCFFQDWEDGDIPARAMSTALGGPIDGVLCEYAVFSEKGLLPIPAGLSFVQAACLPCAAVTAWRCLIDAGGAQAGSTALLLGTGGVSIFALQFAVLNGVNVIMTSSSDAKLARARELGAAATINYRTTPDWDDAVLDLTHGRGVDIVVEVGGAGTLQKSIEAVRVGGRISLVGVLSGGMIDPTAIMRKSVRLQGIYVGSKSLFERMNAAIEQHRLVPVIDSVFEFEAAREAYDYMRSGGHFGKIAISIP